MRYLNADEELQLTGVGYVGEVHEGPDGRLYEWVEGIDAWGSEIGYWQGLPEVQEAGVAGLGALYQASDGSLYQVAGLDEEEAEEAAETASSGTEEDDPAPSPAPKMGPGRAGEIRVGPHGRRYRWVVGVGPGGKRRGFWRRLRPRPRFRRPAARPGRAAMAARRPVPAGRARAVPPGRQPGRKRKGFFKRILPFAKAATALIPGVGPAVAAGLTVATPLLKKAGVAGPGLGALYEAPDGTLYAVHGFAEDDLEGLYDYEGVDDALADDDLDGLAAEEQLEAAAFDDDGRSFAAVEEPAFADAEPAFADAEPLDGYVQDPSISSLQAYIPEPPRQTRMSPPESETPDFWKPIW